MIHLRRQWPWLLLPIVLAGCSSTAGSRFGGTPKSRSIAVVGDRTLPASTGEPGGQVVADTTDPEPRPNPRSRISGRVVDEFGEPVANATVRLADGGAKGGKDIRGTTDRSGAFTLNGLRVGTTYSLVAEAEDDRGSTLSGRVQARTSDSGVEISLLGDEPGSKASPRRPVRPSRAKPISNREEVGEDTSTEAAPRVNPEDVAAPTEESEPLDPGPTPPASRRGRPQPTSAEPSVGWRNTTGTRKTASKPEDREDSSSPSKPEPQATEEDANPLPPAIDPDAPPAESARSSRSKKVGVKSPDKPPGSAELAIEDRSPTEPKPIAIAEARPGPPTSSSTGPPEIPPMGSDPLASLASITPTASPPEAPPTPKNEIPTNPAPQPVFASNGPKIPPSTEYNPFVLAASFPTESREPRTPPAETKPSPSPLDEPSTIDGPAAEAPKKTWGELAAKEKPPAVVEPAKAAAGGSLLKRFRPTPEAKNPAVSQCNYDSRLQKVNDFVLPDLDGKLVRFQDLDADYVLLDFWGTWCAPCVESIPHLIELQKKYGPSRLRVVGIASENVPIDKRRAKVEEFSKRMGINYAVLLSGMDGRPCPVQQALQVQAMPTTILLDRTGQVVWRGTGATPANEFRLDRVLASSVGRVDRGATARR